MNFVVVDVETANPDLSSICQIGIACFRDGRLKNSWESLVNPEDEFDPLHVSIHGIDEEKVRGCPNWAAVYPEVSRLLQSNIVASHTPFDRVALHRACERYQLVHSEYRWLDSAMVVRRAWPMFSRSGYGLSNVAAEFGIQYTPHDALQDACCAGEVLLRAIAESGISIDAWLERVKQPINLPVRTTTELASPRPPRALPRPAPAVARCGNPEGPLFGEVLVFTGALSMPRHEAADAASAAGCEVATSVSKHTTLLVVGDQDIRKLAGYEMSSKHRKAEELMSQGQNIRVITESDFKRITDLVNG
ncbi:exonuclease domain-containing protein [Candidatus Binatus soli]|jgi:DNA polymerase-3 subunit epsilon|uniref:exonuclease domain-containing protein n=1 Tax=Candidatus Binatus soli TaxID=1953413 RepID=UPI003D152ABE